MSIKYSIAPALLLAVALASSCANTVRKPVTEADKDQSGQYDGEWMVKVQAAPKKQPIEQWIFTCKDMEREFPVRVRNGIASIQGRLNKVYDTYINNEGEFRLEMPLDSTTREKVGSFASISAGSNTLIIQGRLAGEEPKGYYTVGVEQFGNNGCTAPVEFAKLE